MFASPPGVTGTPQQQRAQSPPASQYANQRTMSTGTNLAAASPYQRGANPLLAASPQRQQLHQAAAAADYYFDDGNPHHPMMMQQPQYQYQQQQRQDPQSQSQHCRNSPEAHDPAFAEHRMQQAFQADLRAAQPLFSARQIATRHLQSGFQLFAGGKDQSVLHTTRMTAVSPRGKSAGTSVSPIVIDYHDDIEHGKRTMRSMQWDRKQEHKDEARAFVEKHGISILGRMQMQQAAGNADNALPGLLTRKNRQASPSSSHTHLSKHAAVVSEEADGSRFRFTRKMHPEQVHATNLTRSLLPVRKIKTPPATCLASPPRSPRGVRRGPRHAVDTNRVLTPDMIPPSRQSRLKSLRPQESLGQGLTINPDAPQFEWKGGLRGDYWKGRPTDPFGGEP